MGRFAPINVGKVLPPPTHIPAPAPGPLELPRAVGSYEGMDDTGEHAVREYALRHVEPLEGMLVVDCPEAA